jgi:hypothetical protein
MGGDKSVNIVELVCVVVVVKPDVRNINGPGLSSMIAIILVNMVFNDHG